MIASNLATAKLLMGRESCVTHALIIEDEPFVAMLLEDVLRDTAPSADARVPSAVPATIPPASHDRLLRRFIRGMVILRQLEASKAAAVPNRVSQSMVQRSGET